MKLYPEEYAEELADRYLEETGLSAEAVREADDLLQGRPIWFLDRLSDPDRDRPENREES